jgi:MFS family permease
MWAPTWGWVVFANVLLGVNQGLIWSTTIVMKIDLVGPTKRGLAMGFNEAAGYVAVAFTALATGYLAERYGLRPAPFILGLVFAGLGLGISTLFVRETRDHARHEAASHVTTDDARRDELSTGEIFTLTSFREKALSSACQAGLVNNLNDGLAWGLFPIFFAEAGLSVGRIGVLAAVYPAIWGLGQLATGALSDRTGRKPLIAGGMLVQGAAIAIIAATTGFRHGRSGPPCWASARRWCIRRCWPRSGTSPTRRGEPGQSASTGCGATPGSPWARCSPGSSPTSSRSKRRSTPSPRSRQRPASS